MKIETNRRSHIRTICWLIFTFIILSVYYILFQQLFWFKEQSSIFLFTKDFLSDHLILPGGLSSYFGVFFTQFFKYPFLSGLVISLILILSWYLYRNILKIFSNNNYSLFALYSVLYLAYLFSKLDYNLSIIVTHLFIAIACLLYISIKKDSIRYMFGIFSIFLLYWVSNIIFYSGIAVFILYEICCRRGKFFIPVCILYLVISVPIPDLANKYLSIPKSESFFSGFWIMKASVYLKDIQLIYLSLAIFPFTCLLAYIFNIIYKKSNKTLLYIRTAFHSILILFLLLFLIKDSSNSQETRYLYMLNLLRNEKWEKILEYTQNKNEPDFAEMFVYNFTLAKKLLTTEQLLTIKNNSADYYKTESVQGILKYCLTSEIYFHLGIMNGAFYNFFNINKSLNKHSSAYCLSKMGYIELIKGNYPLAKKYYTILSKTFLYAKEAKYYLQLLSNPEQLANDTTIKNKRKILPKDDYFWNEQLSLNLNKYLNSEIDNPVAIEYFLGYALLSKDFELLLPTLKNIISTKHYTDEDIPDLYQQALLSCYRNVTDSIIDKYNISNKNRELYESFQKDIRSGVNINSLDKYKGSYFQYITKK